MAAATKERPTRSSGELIRNHQPLPLEDGVKIWKGTLVAIYISGGTAGEIAPGKVSTTMRALGRATKTVDNADDDEVLEVQAGAHWWDNSAGDPVDVTSIGSLCYIEDDQTVSATDGASTQSPAGKVMDVDAALGVLVMTHPLAF